MHYLDDTTGLTFAQIAERMGPELNRTEVWVAAVSVGYLSFEELSADFVRLIQVFYGQVSCGARASIYLQTDLLSTPGQANSRGSCRAR